MAEFKTWYARVLPTSDPSNIVLHIIHPYLWRLCVMITMFFQCATHGILGEYFGALYRGMINGVKGKLA